MKDTINNASALLEECCTNAKKGPATLYAWFMGEQELIMRNIQDLDEIVLQQAHAADADGRCTCRCEEAYQCCPLYDKETGNCTAD